MNVNEISGEVVDAAIKVHSVLGPGLLEKAYSSCLAHELRLRGLSVRCEVPLELEYEGIKIGTVYRLDLLVEERVVVEVKALAKLIPVHRAQLLSYVRTGRYPVGLLFNFHELRLRDGMMRAICRAPTPAPRTHKPSPSRMRLSD